MNRKKLRQHGKGALEIIEEATHLLRLLPAHLVASYYIGSLPFVLGFFYFWADMSRSAIAHEYVEGGAFTLAVLFLWMKCWHAIFSRRLRAHICNEPSPRWSLIKKLRLVMVQTAIQPTGFIVLPMALLATVPFGWAFAFYQNVSVFGDGHTNDVRGICKKSWHQAKLYPKQNHVLLFVLSVFSIFLFLNVGTMIYLLPHLLKMFFGIDTLFTKAGWSVLNTTFLAVTCGGVYLVLDPLVKCIYVLRCFYGESLQTGEDLKVELKQFRTPPKIVLNVFLVALVWFGMIAADKAFAVQPSSPGYNHQSNGPIVSAPMIDRSIREVIDKREYSWRLPREKPVKEEDQGMCAAFIEGVVETLGRWFSPVKKWVNKFLEWILEKMLRMNRVKEQRDPAATGWMKSLYVLLYVLLAVVTCALALMFWRTWRRRRSIQPETATASTPLPPDITKEEVTADQLSTNSWVDMAREFMEQGNVRLAVRALYLASLSHLAQHEMITIASFKSNREYERELQRRAHAIPDLLSAFSQNVRIFESIWYGMHDVTHEIVDNFNKNQRRVMTFAEQ